MTHLPLTSAQRGIWFAQQVDPASCAFITADCIQAPAAVDPQRLAAAIVATIGEAEGLHARYGVHDGEPVQRLVRSTPIVPILRVPDRAAAERWMTADLARPFDLAAEPPARQAVLVVGDGAWVWWYQAIHHLATDAYATSLLLRRVAGRYAGVAPGAAEGLATLLTLDAAYAGSSAQAADREHWRRAIAGADGAAGVAGRTAPPIGAPHRAVLPWPDGLDAPRALALVATWLARTTGADDVVLGVPWMGRLGSPAARAIACWVNVLPVRLAPTPGDTIDDLARAAHTTLREATRHGRYRYEAMRRDAGRLGEGRRLVGPLVNLKPFVATLDLDGHGASVRNLATGPVEDMTITLGAGRLVVEGHPRLYGRAELDAHAERLARLADADRREGAVASGRLPVARDADRRAELRAARGERVAVPAGTLWSRFADQAARTPDATAVVDASLTLTYRELHDRASALAGELHDRGAGAGRIVGVRMARSAELLAALLGVLRSGAAYLPLEPDQPAARLAELERDAGALCVIEDVPAAGAPATCPAPEPGDAAYVLHTSGSTGRPKGVVVSHRAIVNRLDWMQGAFGLQPGERTLLKTPLGFDVSVWELFWALQVGGTLVVAAPGLHRDPRALATLIVERRVSTVHFVPSMLEAFVAEPTAGACTGLRRIICSGEALGAELARRCLDVLPGAELHNLYGPTEAAVDVTAWPVGREPGPVPIGTPVWNTDAYVLDVALQPCPPGVSGELYLAGAQLADGYLDRPDATAERFVANPYGPPGSRMYRTGDLARRRPDGALEYRGRVDHQIKIRGVRIEPAEVEAALLRHPAVVRTAVLARPVTPGGDPQLVAYVVVDPVAPADPPALRRHAAALLPETMVPAVVVALAELPVGPTGKLDRAALPPPRPQTGAGRAPASPTEERLCALFADVLGLPRASADDGFFDLGGHSLLAARLIGRVRAELGVDATIGSLFAAPTPAALAARLDAGRGDAHEPLLVLRDGGGPALTCIHPAGGLGWCYGPLAGRLSGRRPVLAIQADRTDDGTLAAMAGRYVARLRTAQPSGPYHLLGWSVGGVIAHEMAVQLQAAGERVGVVALLDAYPGDQWRDLPAPTERDALGALALMAGLAPEPGASRERVLERLRQAGSALASLSDEALARIVTTVRHTSALMRRARHGRLRGDVVFFTAAAARAETWVDRDGWAPYVDGAVHNIDLPCAHPELVRAPAVERIADEVSAALTRSEMPKALPA